MDNAYDRRERTVYVSGMHKSITEEHLYDLFQKAGPIEKVILKENQDGSPQHALVVFKNVDSVMFSIAYLQSTQIADQAINVRPLRESTHHSALESAIQQQARINGTPPSSADECPASHPYYLRSQARVAQQRQQQSPQTPTFPSASPQPHYNGPMGASLFAVPASGGSSLYGSPMGSASAYRNSAQAAPGYGRVGEYDYGRFGFK